MKTLRKQLILLKKSSTLNKQQQQKKERPLNFDRGNLKILSLKQMLQILPIAFAQVLAGNTSENFLNEIRQIVYSLY